MTLAVVLSLIGSLMFQVPLPDETSWEDISARLRDAATRDRVGDRFQTLPWIEGDDDLEWIEVERDCEDDCDFPDWRGYLPVTPADIPDTLFRPGGPWVPPTVCDPRDPQPPVPDVTRIEWPEGEITHAAGDGDVVVGMDTEFHWDGPLEVSWTQQGRAGVREDCSSIPGPVETFTARAAAVLFDFEQGEQLQYVSDDRTATHRYTEAGVWTVCVYVPFDVVGAGSTGLVRLAELDHDVVEIRSTLVE